MAHGSVQNAEQYHPLNTEPALEHCNTHLLWKSEIANRCWPSQLTVLSTLPSTSLACGPSSLDVLRKESKVLTCEAVCITCHLSSFEHCHHPRLPTIKSPTAACWDLYIFLYPANCNSLMDPTGDARLACCYYMLRPACFRFSLAVTYSKLSA